tara:strand:+ start:160 stop:387 length:228 start_codon:yes stop_codon:yes gene_type:complete
MQSKKASLIEALINVTVGYLVAVLANYIVLPMFGYMVNITDSFYIGIVFMIIGIIRSYLLRRLFNMREKNANYNT